MQIHSKAEYFSFDSDPPTFEHTFVILQDESQRLYYARSPQRGRQVQPDTIRALELQPISDAALFPPCESGMTLCQDSTQENIFIKRPRLTAYDGTDRVSTWLRHEASICDILRKTPHQNVARYEGCVVRQDRIIGLGFERYAETLRERCDRGIRVQEDDTLVQVEAGLAHIHAQGLIHNDLGPDNIMFRDLKGDEVVIIDFDSCIRRDDVLLEKRGPVPKGVSTAIPDNDKMGVERIRDFIRIKSKEEMP